MCINRESLMWVVVGKFIHFQVIIMRTLSSIWTCSSPPLLSHQLVINICEGTLWHFNSISMFYSPNPPTIHWRRRPSRVDLHRCWREIAEKRTALNIIKVIGITFSFTQAFTLSFVCLLLWIFQSTKTKRFRMCKWRYTLCGASGVSEWKSIRLTGNFFLSYEHLRITWVGEAHRTEYLFSGACPCNHIKKYFQAVRVATTATGTTTRLNSLKYVHKKKWILPLHSPTTTARSSCKAQWPSSVFAQWRKFKLSLVSVFYLKSSN